MSNVVHGLFNNEGIRRALLKTRYLIGPLLLIPVARYMKPEWLWPAFAVSMFGQAIQTWCFASLVKDRELTIRGPYRMCRNPMYLGRYFLMVGFVMLPGNLWLVGLFTIGYYLYMVNRVKREEKRLLGYFGERYEEYCRKVRRFFPSLIPLGEAETWYFRSAPFFENNAHWNILGTLAAYAFVVLLHRFVWI